MNFLKKLVSPRNCCTSVTVVGLGHVDTASTFLGSGLIPSPPKPKKKNLHSHMPTGARPVGDLTSQLSRTYVTPLPGPTRYRTALMSGEL